MTLINKTSNLHYRKWKLVRIIAVVTTVLLGLASRKWSFLLPLFVAQNAGDMLWAMMVYFGFRFLLVGKSPLSATCLSLLFCFCIEFTQLYQEDWINQFRATTLGGLVLGKGFLVVDLIRYTVGIVVATVLDKVVLKFTLRR